MGSEGLNPDLPRRRALKVAVGCLCAEAGFGAAEDSALETLTEMLQSNLAELARTSKAFTELSFRTEPMLSDVVMAMVEMGLGVDSLPAYARRVNKLMLLPPALATGPPQNRTLQVGQRKGHPSHIPDYLPEFPDPHTYIRTLTYKEPATEYQLVREKAASQKRDVERALTRFIAKTGETESLFPDDPYAFPLIANKPKPLPYLDALLPKDQDLESHEEQRPSTPPETGAQKSDNTAKAAAAAAAAMAQTAASQDDSMNKSGTAESAVAPAGQPDTPDSDNQIDNPYLRAIKMPKLRTTGKKYKW